MRQGPLSERLQDAIASEIAFSGTLIDVGVPLSLRALILGSNGNYRLPLIALPEVDDDAEYSNMVRSYLQAAMLFTVGRAFVVTIPNPALGTFTTHGVSEHADAAFLAPIIAPSDPQAVSRIEVPTLVSEMLRTCIPLAPAVLHPDLIELTNQAFQPGCPYELQRVGPDLNPFQYVEGRA